MGLPPADEQPPHPDEHQEPGQVQEQYEPDKDEEQVPIAVIVNGIEAVGRHQEPAFEKHTPVNDEGEHPQPRHQPHEDHGHEAHRRGALPLEEVGQFRKTDGHVGYVVDEEHHGADAGEAEVRAPDDEGVGDEVVHEHLSEVAAHRGTPPDRDGRSQAGLPDRRPELDDEAQLQEAQERLGVVGALRQVVPRHPHLDRVRRVLQVQQLRPPRLRPDVPPRLVPEVPDPVRAHGRVVHHPEHVLPELLDPVLVAPFPLRAVRRAAGASAPLGEPRYRPGLQRPERQDRDEQDRHRFVRRQIAEAGRVGPERVVEQGPGRPRARRVGAGGSEVLGVGQEGGEIPHGVADPAGEPAVGGVGPPERNVSPPVGPGGGEVDHLREEEETPGGVRRRRRRVGGRHSASFRFLSRGRTDRGNDTGPFSLAGGRKLERGPIDR
eukprot:CAMPEP_0183306356 /NCGR_PEP_ID=MMETSP0160_2-20130417/10800_1 /TAXON_ID=2839 ORGANISM="Odontella Sinensis, Strain Grunow 1884" /NCGR_SAMPLE_ID=MMETSP0160_2 /ASSEMBLY_ACC=CAM_ASM_000250 /LENGTH=434 /DNA_ID=CAMNT_0025469711 /DNA_START=261 /DNA_END=1562 /DNA_ORIENTATION=-